MIRVDGTELVQKHFPDGTLLLNGCPSTKISVFLDHTVEWFFERNEEMITLMYITKHLWEHGADTISLVMPYIPNARQDRVKSINDVFTLKYFAEFINSLGFTKVTVLDPHSYVSEALINNLVVLSPKDFVDRAINLVSPNLLFFPDEGSMKRYSGMFCIPYAFGIKKRDWETGDILGLDVSGDVDRIKNSTILIVDDICSRGGTFFHSAKKLKELGAGKIYLFVTHCENTIFQGELLNSGLIETVFTTNSIYTSNHKKVKVIRNEKH